MIQLPRNPAVYLHTPSYFKDPTAAATFFMDGRCNTAVVRAEEVVDPLVIEMLEMTEPHKFNDPEVLTFFHDRPLLASVHMQKLSRHQRVMSLSPVMS